MDEKKKEDLFLGGTLRLGYEILKKNIKNPKYDSVFEFFESIGKEIRTVLETDSEYKHLYTGADIVRKGTEFWEELRKAFEK